MCLTVLSSEDSVPRKFVILCYETLDKGQKPENLKCDTKSRKNFGVLQNFTAMFHFMIMLT